MESFNGRLRDELLNETLFSSLAHAREVLSLWKDDYNIVRPHSGLGNLTPAAYAKSSAPEEQRDGTLRCTRAPRPVPLLHRAKWAQMNSGLYPSLDERRGSDRSPASPMPETSQISINRAMCGLLGAYTGIIAGGFPAMRARRSSANICCTPARYRLELGDVHCRDRWRDRALAPGLVLLCPKAAPGRG